MKKKREKRGTANESIINPPAPIPIIIRLSTLQKRAEIQEQH
jgi:hypothetical protein